MKNFTRQLFLFLVFFSFLKNATAQNTCAAPFVINDLPFNSGSQTTCGKVNDFAVGTFCNSSYGGGEDYVYTLTIANAPVTWAIALGGTDVWKIASVHSACPPTSANSVGCVTTGSGSTGSANVTFPTNGTYYIIIDTWPTPNCGNFTLDITAPPPPPANDNICGAVALSVSANTTCTTLLAGQTTLAATQSAVACTGTADDDVWYSFVATATAHTITYTSTGTGLTDRVHQVYSSSDNTCTGTLTSILCSDPDPTT
jgi:trimeric autotransporter adhesin